MRSVIVVDAPARRMIGGLLFFLVIGVALSLWEGDGLGTIAARSAVGLACGGFILACYWWARRK
jgi:hypothetical protein